MHQKMQEQSGQFNNTQQDGFKPRSATPNPGNKPKSGDYIEFEEVNAH